MAGIVSTTHFLKRYIPGVPGWILSGVFLVLFISLIVLSVEFSQLAAGNDFEHNTWAWYVRPLYAPGWLLLMATQITLHPLDSPIAESMRIVLLCLIIWSPVHFIIGALLATSRKALGIALLVLNLMVGCFSTFMLIILAD
jgi:hypothetical protein